MPVCVSVCVCVALKIIFLPETSADSHVNDFHDDWRLCNA